MTDADGLTIFGLVAGTMLATGAGMRAPRGWRWTTFLVTWAVLMDLVVVRARLRAIEKALTKEAPSAEAAK